jgi:hypothetical protein
MDMKRALLPLLLGLFVACLAVAARAALAEPPPPAASAEPPVAASSSAVAPSRGSAPGCEEPRRQEPSLFAPEVIGPLVSVPTAFFTVLAIVAMSLLYRYRKDKQRLETVRFLADKGQEVPLELLVPPAKRITTGTLKAGLVLLLGGTGLSVSLLLAHETDAVGFGLIPGLIGVAYLVVWKVESGQASARARE